MLGKVIGIKDMFVPPSADYLARKYLAEARRELLAHQAQAEYAAKMVEYYQGVVFRLSLYVSTEAQQ